MPHTSKRKKPDRNKRKEVLDEDGWTRVTSGPKPSAPDHLHPARTDESQFEPYTLRLDLDDVTSVTSWAITPRPPVKGMTIETLVSKYNAIESRWQKSESCRVLKDVLDTRVLSREQEISSCVCFGTSTPSGLRGGWIQRHEVALYQIAVFKSVVDTIEQVQGTRPPAFAQEPDYNDLDEALLGHLSITRVNHPAAFCLLTSSSFAYAPGAELFVNLRTLAFDPAIYLGAALDLYRGRDGRMYSNLVGSVENAYKDGDIYNNTTQRQEEDFESSRIIDAYTRGKEVVKLPDLVDVKDYPFYQVHLHWRPPRNDEQVAAIP